MRIGVTPMVLNEAFSQFNVMNRANYSILNVPIDSLDVSAEFRMMAAVNNFGTLAELLALPFAVVHRLLLSDYRIAKEILKILEQHDLMDLVDD